MPDRLVLIHTVPPLVDVFKRLCAELLPDVQLYHVLDEPLLERVRQHQGLATDDLAQLQAHIDVAAQIGARAVLVTCSTLSPGVDHITANIPIVKIDEAMIAQAVGLGRSIGVIATAQSTLEPTCLLLTTAAHSRNKSIEIQTTLVDHALASLLQGDGATHDRLVAQAIAEMSPQVNVVVLAQASMARVIDVRPQPERKIPILTSPHTAIERVRQYLT
ncbi:MAG TPA: aspartate/glutamate racemase family protein [Anaerolineae bacterium]|nr:aspartate/glutamate racemase family protein [Anaerolineae bacterium]